MNETPKLLRLISIAPRNSNTLYKLSIRCHITPASRGFQGVKKICNEQVYIHVGSEPRKGEANAAVAEILSEVLGIPKSDISIMGKQKVKVGQMNSIDIGKLTEEEYLRKMRRKIIDACLEKPQE